MGRPKGQINADPLKFAKARAAGKPIYEAYQIAMDGKSKGTKQTNEECGERLAKRPDVKAAIEYYKQLALDKVKADPETIAAKYTEIAFNDDIKPETQIQALDRLAKMSNMFSENVNIQHSFISMDDRKAAISDWINKINGEITESSEVGRPEPGEVADRE